MIYIYNMLCVLAVRDNALDVGNVKDVLSEAAKVPHNTASWLRVSGQLGICGMCYEV